MSVYQIGKGLPKYIGLSTDTKPTAADPQNLQYPEIGSTYLEGDTGKLFVTYDRTNWGVKAEMVTFGGAVYENEDTATADTARRFETASTKLRDVIIQISGYGQLFGTATNQRYLLDVGDTWNLKKVDISTLYFKNATAGQNGVVNIIGVRE